MRWSFGIFLGFIALVFAPFFLWGECFVPGDFLSFIYPWRAYQNPNPHNLELFDVAVFFYPQDVFLSQSLNSGVFPFWNPHIFAGHPAVASGQSGFFYPPRILAHLLWEPAVAKTVLQLVHVLAMGLAMRAFLKERGFSELPCLVASLAWMGNTQVAGWLEFEHLEIAGTYLPLLLLSLEKGLKGDQKWWVLMGVFGALSLHSGHLQYNLYTGLIFISYAAYRLWQQQEISAVIKFGGVGILTLGLAAPTVLPFLELLPLSQRQNLIVEHNVSGFWSICLSLFSPDLFGNPAKGFMMNRCQANLIYPEFACFVGTCPLILALAARGRSARILQSISFFCLLFASASFGLELPFLSRFIPGRLLLVLVFCLCCLAAIGCQQYLESPKTVRMMAGVHGIVCLALMGTIVYLYFNPEPLLNYIGSHPGSLKIPPAGKDPAEVASAFRSFASWNPQLILPLVGAGLLLLSRGNKHLIAVLTALELALFMTGFNTSLPPEKLMPSTPEIQVLSQGENRSVSVSCANYNTLTPYGVRLVNGYESLVPTRHAMALEQASPGKRLNMRSLSFSRLDKSILDALAVEYALLPPHLDTDAEAWELVFEGKGGKVYRNTESLQRAYLVGSVRPLRHPRELQEFDPANEAFVSSPPPPDLAKGEGKIQWLYEDANRVRLGVTSSTSQLLVLTDAYTEGWKCYRNGELVPVFPANLASRGVYVAPGYQELEFRYEPALLALGLKLMTATLTIALILLLALALKSRQPREG